VASRVRETQWHRSERLEEQADGTLLWRARIAEPREMVWWIRGWGADVEVLAPCELREEMMGEARRLAESYGWHVSRGAGVGEDTLSRTFSDFFGG